MNEIKRLEVDEYWADSTIVEAGDYVFVGYCMKNEGESIEKQIDGAFDVLEKRLKIAGLSLLNDFDFLKNAGKKDLR